MRRQTSDHDRVDIGSHATNLRYQRSQTLREKAYRFVKQQVASGVLAPGSVLKQSELVAKIGASRTPIREAIRQLIAEGVLMERPGGHLSIVKLTQHDLNEFKEIEEAIRLHAIGRLYRIALNPGDLFALRLLTRQTRSVVKEMNASNGHALDESQMCSFAEVVNSFQALVVRTANNSLIIRLFHTVREATGTVPIGPNEPLVTVAQEMLEILSGALEAQHKLTERRDMNQEPTGPLFLQKIARTDLLGRERLL